jgi:Leucine-rich repeat (LRR) protein
VRFEASENSLAALPSGIRDWRSLEILDLHSNNIKEIPAAIWDLKLKYLNLSSNVIEQWPEIPQHGLTSGVTSDERSFRVRASTAMVAVPLTPVVPPLDHIVDVRGLSKGPETDSYMQLEGSSGHMSLIMNLQWLSVADNRLDSGIFENPIQHLGALRSLNVSHNDAFAVPVGSLRNSASTLEELYLSGNHFTNIPEDIFTFTELKRLYINGNRLSVIPPELAQASNLRVLDVGRNQLRYNVGNWPYDWNWNQNVELRYLNLSGNSKLEIKPSASDQRSLANQQQQGKRGAKNIPDIDVNDKQELYRFDALTKLRILSLMDVNVGVPLPEETPNRRVRTCAPCSTTNVQRKNIDVWPADLTVTFTPSKAKETPAGDGTNADNSLPFVGYGVADNLGENEICHTWDMTILGAKFLQQARDESRPQELGNAAESKRGGIPSARSNECVFGMFDGGMEIGSWICKWLNDNFVTKFDTELKKLFKERHVKKLKLSARKGSGDQNKSTQAKETTE